MQQDCITSCGVMTEDRVNANLTEVRLNYPELEHTRVDSHYSTCVMYLHMHFQSSYIKFVKLLEIQKLYVIINTNREPSNSRALAEYIIRMNTIRCYYVVWIPFAGLICRFG